MHYKYLYYSPYYYIYSVVKTSEYAYTGRTRFKPLTIKDLVTKNQLISLSFVSLSLSLSSLSIYQSIYLSIYLSI